MEFKDYSPTASPTLDQQRDALRKGLGRSLQWAGLGKLSDEPLLEACLHDLRYDRQFEHCRGAWLWEALTAVNGVERFREPIFGAFQRLSDEDDVNQLCELGLRFASGGDQRFRKRLYEVVQQKPFADLSWLGEEEVVALDGKDGLLFVARVRGEQLSTRKWECDDVLFADEVVERFGEEQVLAVFGSAEDQSIRRYRDAWLRHRNRTTGSKESHKERMQASTVDEIIKSAEAEGASRGLFRGWGIHASTNDLETVFVSVP